jgi:hypothetical protein
MCNELLPKPKGLHWNTYDRLTERYDPYGARGDQGFKFGPARRLGCRNGRQSIVDLGLLIEPNDDGSYSVFDGRVT